MADRKSSTSFTLSADSGSNRLDKAIRNFFPSLGKKAAGKLIQDRQVRVNGKTVWLASWKVHPGDRIEIKDPPTRKSPVFSGFDDTWLLADEGDLLVVCKPAGLLSQSARGRSKVNLLSFAQERFGEEVRLFHRLDRDTSGLCLLTRPGPVNAYLDEAFKARQVKKYYRAILQTTGRLEEQGELRSYLAPDPRQPDRMMEVEKGGKFAFTSYQILGKEEAGWQIALQPHTGRTHQLRVQLAVQDAPIIGDRLYGGSRAPRLMLHSARIELPAIEEWPLRSWQCRSPFK